MCACVCVCVCVYVIDFVYQLRLNLCIHRLTLEWDEFRKSPKLSQILSDQTVANFGEVKMKMTNTMTINIYLYKKWEEVQMGWVFLEDENYSPICSSSNILYS